MNWQLNVGWTYPFAKKQEEWDMTDRAAIIAECIRVINAGIAHAEATINSFGPHESDPYVTTAKSWLESVANKIRALAAVPPAPPSIGMQMPSL